MLPIGHENMSARRWPVITLGLIAINTVIFLFTYYGTTQPPLKTIVEVPVHILVLAAEHPELNMSPETQHMATYFRERAPEFWAQLKDENREPLDAWEMEIRLLNRDTEALQHEMDSLSQQYLELRASIPALHYGFIPSERQPMTYVTANFLHGGWLHLIGNMWLLWLAGFVLEDVWGRVIYAVFYLVAGALALQFYAWTTPGSIRPLIGASGAIAGLMGAFLVRFPKLKIEMAMSILIRRFRFKAPAWCLLPLWLLMEVFYAKLFGEYSPVAHWAHVGGFVLGGFVALLLRVSKLEHKINQSIEQKTTWTCDPAIEQATELMDQNQLDDALTVLTGFTASHPDSVDGANLLQQVCFRKGDMPAFREASMKLCALYLKTREWELAWQCCQEMRGTSQEKLPANLWFDLCRAAENLKNFDLALAEYEMLAAAYPNDRQGMMALIGAGRICLSQLQRPQEALGFFQAAAASPVPHLDWEQTIEAGIRNAKAAMTGTAAGVPMAPANR